MKEVDLHFILYHRKSKKEIVIPVAWICAEYSCLSFSTREGDYKGKYNGIDRLHGNVQSSLLDYNVFVVINGEKFIYNGLVIHPIEHIECRMNELNK
jgi:hypothetical protein